MMLNDNPIFNISPIPLWLEDFSDIKKQLDTWRKQGVQDLRQYLFENPSLVAESTQKIKILNVNTRTLELYEARHFNHLCENLDQIFQQDMLNTHINELVELWEGKTHFSNTAVNYTLNGKRLDIQLRCTILPEHEHDWSQVLISTENITPYRDACRLEEKTVNLPNLVLTSHRLPFGLKTSAVLKRA